MASLSRDTKTEITYSACCQGEGPSAGRQLVRVLPGHQVDQAPSDGYGVVGEPLFALVTSACGPRVALIPGINRCADVPPPHEPFVAPAHPTGLDLRRSSKGSGVSRGHRGVGSRHQHQRVAEVMRVRARGGTQGGTSGRVSAAPAAAYRV
jgi:hypothetical protein